MNTLQTGEWNKTEDNIWICSLSIAMFKVICSKER
jgi:hypothetical protein